MHISRIEISNYRNFKELRLIGLDSATVIVGENAVGKSNLLDALRLVLDPSLPDTARILPSEDFWDGLSKPFGGAVIQVVIELTGYTDDPNAKAVLSDATIQLEPLTARLTYLYRPRQAIGNAAVREAEYEFVVFGGNDQSKRIGSDVRRYVSLHLLPALRDAENNLLVWHRSPLRPLLERLKLPDDDLSQLTKSIAEVSEKVLTNTDLQDLNTALGDRLTMMLGEVFPVKTRFGVAAMQPEQILKAIRLFIAESKDRSVSEASLGTANLLFLTLLLEELTKQKEANEIVTTILAVEEPEAHLHPHLQRVLFRYLLRLKSPLLLSTHSPHIASVTPLRSLVALRRTKKEGTIGFRLRHQAFKEIEIRDIERYLDVTRAEVLFSKGVILVEGPAETFLIPEFARNMGIELDSLGITICAVNGVDFAPYRKLLGKNGFGIPHVIITDGDGQLDQQSRPKHGVKRGSALPEIPDTDNKVLEKLVSEEKFENARLILRNFGVFVSLMTLEIDLLPSAAEAMKKAWNELFDGSTSQANFGAAVDGATQHDTEQHKQLLNRVEQCGKGRFAQRLAGHLSSIQAPEHIRLAIEYITEEVRKNA